MVAMSSAVCVLMMFTLVISSIVAVAASIDDDGDEIDDRNASTNVSGSSTGIPTSEDALLATTDGNFTHISSTVQK